MLKLEQFHCSIREITHTLTDKKHYGAYRFVDGLGPPRLGRQHSLHVCEVIHVNVYTRKQLLIVYFFGLATNGEPDKYVCAHRIFLWNLNPKIWLTKQVNEEWNTKYMMVADSSAERK